MKILRNYILKDFLGTFMFSALSLTMIMLLGNLMKLADMIIRKGVNAVDALKIFFFFMPYILGFILPISFLLGVLLAMGRLIADNEIIAINCAGVSRLAILKPFLIMGVIASLLLIVINDRVVPNFHYQYRTQLSNIYSKNMSSLIEPGVFLENFENYVIYVSDSQNNKLKNVYIYETADQNGVSKVTFAKQAEFTIADETLRMRLEDGFKDENNPKNRKELYRLNFKNFFMDIPIVNKSQKVWKKPSDMSLRELKQEIKKLQMPLELEVEFHKRISFSFSAITFIILAFGVSFKIKHREKSINFGIAFLAAGFYYLFFLAGQSLAEYGKISAPLAMWLPNAITVATGLFFIHQNAHSR